jgi:hypothetical protein
MKKLIAFLLIYTNSTFTFCQIMSKEKFKAVSYSEAIKLKEEKKGEFLENIPFNNANIFVLKDSSFLILPLNPYTTALIVYEKGALEEMLKTNTFPVKEESNSFYDANKEKIENIDVYGGELITELENYLKSNNFVFENTDLNVDSVYNFLKAKKTLGKYKLNFIVFLANIIIKSYDQSLKIGLLKEKQALNPMVSIVLVNQTDSNLVFFNLERQIFGRSNYYGIQDILNNLAQLKKKVNAINVIDKVFDWPA